MSVYVYHVWYIPFKGGQQRLKGGQVPPPAPLNETLLGINFSGLNV